MIDLPELQRSLCREYGAAFSPPVAGSRVGIALQTLGRLPLHGLRIPERGGANGWYLWAGEDASEDPEFYQALCFEHLAERCPIVLRFLALPAGWRFLTDGSYVDVWQDSRLLEPRWG